jgi:hypothetical protein
MASVKMYTSNYCPFCSRAKALLLQRGVTNLEEIVVDGQPELRARMTQITGRTSVHQRAADFHRRQPHRRLRRSARARRSRRPGAVAAALKNVL